MPVATAQHVGAAYSPERMLAARERSWAALRDIASRIEAGMDEAAWLAIRPNLASVAEAPDWWHVVEGPVAATIAGEDRDYLALAARIAGDIDWTRDPWHTLTGRLKDETGRKGRALFLPLRQALTGRDHGPDMAALLPLIGRARAIERLTAN